VWLKDGSSNADSSIKQCLEFEGTKYDLQSMYSCKNPDSPIFYKNSKLTVFVHVFYNLIVP
jgi:hypothetical protein